MCAKEWLLPSWRRNTQGHFTGNFFWLFIIYLFLKRCSQQFRGMIRVSSRRQTQHQSLLVNLKRQTFNKPARRIRWQVFAHAERFRSHAFGVSSSEKDRCWLRGYEGAGDCRWLRNAPHSSSVSHTCWPLTEALNDTGPTLKCDR